MKLEEDTMHNVKNATAVTKVFPDGQKVVAVVIEFEKDIDGKSLEKDSFSIAGRLVADVYVNSTSELSVKENSGKFVVIEFVTEGQTENTLGVIFDDEGRMAGKVIKSASLAVQQEKGINSVDGEKFLLQSPIVTSKVRNLVVEKFAQGEFCGLKYNLFVPENYDPNEKYPLVMFIEDAGQLGNDPIIALAQGMGGVIWATDEEQAKHPCFVLCPQYPSPTIVDDEFRCRQGVNDAKLLLDHIVNRFSIDRNRLYITGQSMGCMTSCELNIRYPDLFAASILVAGQWAAKEMGVSCPNMKAWILVSDGDMKAYPGMTEITDALRENGAQVTKYYWNAKAPTEELEAQAKVASEDGSQIHFTIFTDHSVVPDYVEDTPLSNHMNTWCSAYNIEAVRDWLFTISK
jgi:predicted peptidase